MSPVPDALGAIVLAGGRSRRMGDDKAGLDWHGRPLVAHVAAVLGDCVGGGPVVVVGPAAGVPRWADALPTGVEVVHDDVADAGPVAGLATAMAAFAGRASRVLLAATDQPLLAPATFAPLLAAVGAPADRRSPSFPGADGVGARGTAAWRADGHLQPLGAVYAVGSVPADTRRLKDLFTDATILDADADTAATLRSLDTPAAYAAARGLRRS